MRYIYGLYANPESAQRAVSALQILSAQLKFDKRQIIVVSGEPHEGFEFADAHITSRPYGWVLLGGAIGGASGYLLTTLTERAYPIQTGGMPIVSPWTNGIIIYELTMLGAILTTLVTLLWGAGLPRFRRAIDEPNIWLGQILVGVTDPPASSEGELERCLSKIGPAELKRSSGA